MNKLMFGALAGVAGGAGKYQEIQDEQRQYNLDNKKAQQDQMRKESFARFNYNMQDSGMLDANGNKLSREDVAALPDEQKGALKPEWQAKSDYKTAADEKIRKEKEGDEWSQYTLKDGTKIKKKDLDEVNKSGQEIFTAQEQQIAMQDVRDVNAEERDIKRQGRRQELVSTADANKTKSSFRKDIGKALKETGNKGEDMAAILKVAQGTYGDSAEVYALPQVKKARFINQGAQAIADMQNQSMGREEVLAEMKKSKMTKDDFDIAVDFAISKGWFEEAMIEGIAGYKGKGW